MSDDPYKPVSYKEKTKFNLFIEQLINEPKFGSPAADPNGQEDEQVLRDLKRHSEAMQAIQLEMPNVKKNLEFKKAINELLEDKAAAKSELNDIALQHTG
jgi:hypothetical protein